MSFFDILILLTVQGGFFVLLALALRYFFFKQVQAALARLRALQEEAMIKEAQLKEELDRARSQSASIITSAQGEAAALREHARGEVMQVRVNAEGEGEKLKKEIIESGRKDLEKLEVKLRRQADEDAVDIAVQYTSALFSDAARVGADTVYVAEAIAALTKVPLDMTVVQAPDAQVVSARALTAQEQTGVAAALADKAPGLPVFFAVDPALVGGLVVTVGEFVADGSLRNRIARLNAATKG